MKYLVTALVAFGLGVVASPRLIIPPEPPAVVAKAPPTKLPKEVQEQFDAYLLTTPVLETVVVRIVKKVLETVLIASFLALVTDYPLQALFLWVSLVTLVSYPVTRYLISREIHSKVSGPSPPVLSA